MAARVNVLGGVCYLLKGQLNLDQEVLVDEGRDCLKIGFVGIEVLEPRLVHQQEVQEHNGHSFYQHCLPDHPLYILVMVELLRSG